MSRILPVSVASPVPIALALAVGLSLVASATVCAGETSAEKPLARRIAEREFPSVFQAWNPADNLKDECEATTAARHDLIFQGARFFGLEWDHKHQGLATGFTPESLERGHARRRDLLERNPNLVLLMEIRYRDAWGPEVPQHLIEQYPEHLEELLESYRGFLPKDHPWWRRDAEGNIVKGWEEGGFLQMDFSNPEYRE